MMNENMMSRQCKNVFVMVRRELYVLLGEKKITKIGRFDHTNDIYHTLY